MSENTEPAQKNQPAAGEKEESEWAKPWFVISAIVIGFIVVIAGVVLVFNLFIKPAGQAQTPDVTTADPAAGCPVQGSTDQAVPTTAPPARWVLFKQIAIPTSTEAGPFAADPAGIRSCYAHTPTGALFAASNMVALGSQQETVTVLERFTVPSALRDTELKKAKSSASGSSGNGQVAGYTLTVQDQDRVQVRLAVKVGAGLVAGTYDLQWLDGDWKVRMETPLSVTRLDDLSGFIPFNGV